MFNKQLDGITLECCFKYNVRKIIIVLTINHQNSNEVFVFYINQRQPYIKLNSWFTEKRVPSVKSLGELTWGSYNRTCRLSFGKATKDYVEQKENKIYSQYGTHRAILQRD